MRIGRWVCLLSILLLSAACKLDNQQSLALLMQTAEARQREMRFQRAVAERQAGISEDGVVARWLLPPTLNEVSGLSVAADGRLFAHGDEKGIVATLDYRTGVLIKEFVVGKLTDAVDFEGITAVHDTLLMIVSNGDIYEFREGEPGTQVEFAVHKMGLEKECEFEGVAYDATLASVLLACKTVKNEEMKDSLVIFRWKMREATAAGPTVSRLAIPIASVAAPIDLKEMHPSDIAVDPVSGNYVLVAAQEKALMEITPQGQVLWVRKLPAEHLQAEGLAVTKDLIIVGDEAVRARATLTLYRRP